MIGFYCFLILLRSCFSNWTFNWVLFSLHDRLILSLCTICEFSFTKENMANTYAYVCISVQVNGVVSKQYQLLFVAFKFKLAGIFVWKSFNNNLQIINKWNFCMYACVEVVVVVVLDLELFQFLTGRIQLFLLSFSLSFNVESLG